MDNKAPSLWDAKCEAPKGLRPPNAPPSRLLEDKKSPEKPQENTKPFKSSLSADAPEFVPSYMKSATQSSGGVQDRLKKFKVVENSGQNDSEFVGSPDDIRLKHLIDTLTKDPGQFSDLLDIFMDTLCPYFGDILVLARAAHLLVEQAIVYPSFRYTAARLCCFIEQCCPEFRAELHLTCQKELKNHTNKSGLLLFVAELYTQLHHENIYGSYLIDAYKHLLGVGGNENVKSICQALKLTGYSLELYDKKALDEVFEKLNEVKPTVTGTPLSLINSVINLRSSQWGHNSPTNSSSNSEVNSENTYWSEETSHTVFYNTDGSKFTSEENDFLAANMNSTEEYLTDLSDPDELCDPEPEMDEEIQAAFKDFVKLSKR
ncbi:polyadenylate-binding protein-interacting protein 1 [Tribolium madens]|uniref:polyadenylate-binding protein-interacting protein 1 n=1 Tax=Tribolium madens TaxID=41895 RepID=UPI001CF72856|nr:polyadenylate-binding protein-interacting protein 1 [Tribolium madens]